MDFLDSFFGQAFDRALERIANTKVSLVPFPHVIVDEVFSPGDYAELQHRMLAKDGCWRHQAGRRWPYAILGARGIDDIGLTAGNTHSMRSIGSDVERQFETFVKSARFVETLIGKFGADSADGQSVKSIATSKLEPLRASSGFRNCVSGGELVKDLPGYEYPPHPDKADKVATFLFYLSAGNPQSGTHLCSLRPEFPFALRPGYSDAGFYAWRNFDSHEVAFVANRFVAFAPTTKSFHAVKVPPAVVPRPDALSGQASDRLVFRGFIRSRAPRTQYLYDGDLGELAAMRTGLAGSLAIVSSLPGDSAQSPLPRLKRRLAFQQFVLLRILMSNSHLLRLDQLKESPPMARLWWRSWELAAELAADSDQVCPRRA